MNEFRQSDAHALRLARMGYVALALAAAYWGYDSDWEDLRLTIASIAMLALGVVPMLRWIGRNDAAYPIHEFLLLTTVPFYALPLITGHDETQRYSEPVLLQATLVVIGFQLSVLAGSWLMARNHRPSRRDAQAWWRSPILAEQQMKFTGYTFVLTSLWLVVLNFTDWVSADLIGTFRAIFIGIGIISAFIQARLWAARELNAMEKTVFVINLAVQTILSFKSLLLINGIGLLLTALAGYFTVARRIPWIPVVLLFPLLAILHNGKGEMRKIYWSEFGDDRQVENLPEFFMQWIQLGLPGEGHASGDAEEKEQLTLGLMRRASLFHLVCVTVTTIPDRRDYLLGESYTNIPALFVPRFVWPEKPSPQSSVTLMAVHLGVLSAEAAKTTSIGFGMLTEAYANYGYLAIAGLGLVFGYAFRWLGLATIDCATLSLPGLLRILCIVWCFNAESTLAVWLSSLYQAVMAICVPLIGWKKLFGE